MLTQDQTSSSASSEPTRSHRTAQVLDTRHLSRSAASVRRVAELLAERKEDRRPQPLARGFDKRCCAASRGGCPACSFQRAWRLTSSPAGGGPIEGLGAVPRVLVWDGEGAVGRWRGGRSELTADTQAFRGVLGANVPILHIRARQNGCFPGGTETSNLSVDP